MIGFGTEPGKEAPYDEYIGTYVRVMYGNGNNTSGRLDEVNGENLKLGNHISVKNHPVFGQLLTVNYNGLKETILLSSVHGIEQTSLEDIINYCVFQNEKRVRAAAQKIK